MMVFHCTEFSEVMSDVKLLQFCTKIMSMEANELMVTLLRLGKDFSYEKRRDTRFLVLKGHGIIKSWEVVIEVNKKVVSHKKTCKMVSTLELPGETPLVKRSLWYKNGDTGLSYTLFPCAFDTRVHLIAKIEFGWKENELQEIKLPIICFTGNYN